MRYVMIKTSSTVNVAYQLLQISTTPKIADAKRKTQHDFNEDKDTAEVDVEGEDDEEDTRTTRRASKRTKREKDQEEDKEDKSKSAKDKDKKDEKLVSAKKEDAPTTVSAPLQQFSTPTKAATPAVPAVVTPVVSQPMTPTPIAMPTHTPIPAPMPVPMPSPMVVKGFPLGSPTPLSGQVLASQFSPARPVTVTGLIPTATSTPVRSVPRPQVVTNSRTTRGAMDRDGPTALSNISHFGTPVGSATSTTAAGLPPAPTMAIAPGAKVEVSVSSNAAPPYPLQCAWFNVNEIHDIERASLPEFFGGKFASKTPLVYVQNKKNTSIYLFTYHFVDTKNIETL